MPRATPATAAPGPGRPSPWPGLDPVRACPFRDHEIVVVVHPHTTVADARATLLHEAVHLAGYERHDVAFKHALAEAAAELHGVDLREFERGPYRRVDRELERALWWVGWREWAKAAVSAVVGACRIALALGPGRPAI